MVFIPRIIRRMALFIRHIMGRRFIIPRITALDIQAVAMATGMPVHLSNTAEEIGTAGTRHQIVRLNALALLIGPDMAMVITAITTGIQQEPRPRAHRPLFPAAAVAPQPAPALNRPRRLRQPPGMAAVQLLSLPAENAQ